MSAMILKKMVITWSKDMVKKLKIDLVKKLRLQSHYHWLLLISI